MADSEEQVQVVKGATTEYSCSEDSPPTPPEPHVPENAPIARDEDTETESFLTESQPVNNFTVSDCPVGHVVVYMDRAEVCRSLKVKLIGGENEIIINQLSPAIDKESIRVEGHGSATILEVTYSSKYVLPEEDSVNQRGRQLEAEIKELQKEKATLEAWKTRVSKQRSVLDGFADNLTRVKEIKDKDGNVTPMCGALDASVLDGMTKFFGMYDSQANHLDTTLQDVQQKIDDVEAEIAVRNKNLTDMAAEREDSQTRDLSILIGCEGDVEVTLFVSYIVMKAKWSPKYDIRVFSNDGQMKIMYYAMIQQASDEDWVDAKLSLSTSLPSMGGQVPDLGTHRLYFKPKKEQVLPLNINGLDLPPLSPKNTRQSMRKVKKRPQSVLINSMDLNRSLDEALFRFEEEKARKEIDVEKEKDRHEYPELPMEVKDGIVSTTMEISRKYTIPSDNQAHKVPVAIIDLSPLFEYECVPKKTAHAYLKARVKNTSSHALLAGPTNIFLDNNFIAKADLKEVSPSEEFTCSLGVDPGVRVTYRPISKFREQTGIISKKKKVPTATLR